MSVQDRMVTFFKALGYTGAVNDMYRKYLLDQTSQTSGSTDDLLRYFLRDRWGCRGSLDDMLREHLRYLGYTGSITDMLYAAWGSAGIAGISFAADLKTTVVPNYGSGSATYTRATTATITDHEDVVRPVLSGEVRFQGARRVYNRLTLTESLDSWSKSSFGTGSAAVVETGKIAPDGTTTAYRIYGDAGAAGLSYLRNLVSGSATWMRSIWIKSNNGNNQTLLKLQTNIGGLVVTPTWQRYGVLGIVGGSNFMDIGVQTTGLTSGSSDQTFDVLVWHPQMEDITGQSIQTPGEYVSVGVLSSPYHGAMVDGVKYFATTNGNTISSNVVTEATGSSISSATLKGYLAEGARTNLCLQSEVLGTTWAAPTGMALASNNTTAPDGAATADKLTDDSGTSGHYIEQTGLTFSTATAYTFSAFVKWASGTRNVFLQFYTNSGADQAYVILNSSGAVVTSAAVGSMASVSASVTSYPSGWYRVTVRGTTGGTAGAGAVRIGHGNGSSAPPPGYTGNGTDASYWWGAQLEAGAFASSYIPTTTASVPRNADVLTYPFSGNASASVGSAYAELSTQWTTSGASAAVSFSVGEACLWCPATVADTTIRILDGVNSGIKTGLTNMSTASRKRASSWGGSTISVTGDGAAVASNSFDGGMGSTSIGIGNVTDGSTNWFGTIRNVRIYQTQLSAAQLQTITT